MELLGIEIPHKTSTLIFNKDRSRAFRITKHKEQGYTFIEFLTHTQSPKNTETICFFVIDRRDEDEVRCIDLYIYANSDNQIGDISIVKYNSSGKRKLQGHTAFIHPRTYEELASYGYPPLSHLPERISLEDAVIAILKNIRKGIFEIPDLSYFEK